MAKVLRTRINKNGEIIYELNLNPDESLKLQGYLDNIYLFSEELFNNKGKVSFRGRNEATKYFLIPAKQRRGLNFGEVAFHKLDFEDKAFFIYAVKKNYFEDSQIPSI